MDKYCVIDIGTNSIRMLIAKVEDRQIVFSKKTLETTRIGEGVDRTQRLSLSAVTRSINALKKFKEQALKEGIKSIDVIATSAVRDAVNKHDFINVVKDEVDLDVQVISGEKEAQLGFMGVINGIDANTNNLLVIDIGGGSTEFILGNDKGIKYCKSLNIGAVRMTDKYIDNDPIADYEMDNLTADIRSIVNEIIYDINKFGRVEAVGIGGTVTSLVAIALGLEIYDKDKVHNYELKIEEIQGMMKKFKSLNNDERKKIRGLQSKRADIILAGSNILHEILIALGLNTIRISEFDNLEGYVYKELGEVK